MHSTKADSVRQFNDESFLHIPSALRGFRNTSTEHEHPAFGESRFIFHGQLLENDTDRICPECGSHMLIKSKRALCLQHLPFGLEHSCISTVRNRYCCPCCHHTHMQSVDFKTEGHSITVQLKNMIEDLLSTNQFTLKAIAQMAGVHPAVVKAIDKNRLRKAYTDNGLTLKKPDTYSHFLGIDEFKLHIGHRYATHIIDLETGHILWIAHGKKKDVVYKFIAHVGQEWMSHVQAAACDMNSDFQEAFEEKCLHLEIIYDYFHIVKNFNDKVIAEVRKEEQAKLIKEGREEEAVKLKRTRYILMSSTRTLKKKDEIGIQGRLLKDGSVLFGIEPVKAKSGYMKRYKELIDTNKLFFTIDLVKSQLEEAFSCADEVKMGEQINSIIDVCEGTGNKHFKWIGKLLKNHFRGIIKHAVYRISNGKIEGINNKIKTIRRMGYGYPDDEYFFLKLMDMSRASKRS
jgi:transposase